MAKNTPDKTSEPAAAPSFEQTLSRLEEIVHLLEEGKIGLDEALARYEEGVGLLRQACDLLQRAERRIAILSGVDAEGNPVLHPLDDVASFSLQREVAGGDAPALGRDAGTGRRTRRSPEAGSS